jgi:hypothetical protein
VKYSIATIGTVSGWRFAAFHLITNRFLVFHF